MSKTPGSIWEIHHMMDELALSAKYVEVSAAIFEGLVVLTFKSVV